MIWAELWHLNQSLCLRNNDTSQHSNTQHSTPTTTGRLNWTQKAISSELHAMLFCINLSTDDYHCQAIMMCLLHDVNCSVKGHSWDDLHQDLNNVLPLVVVVIMQHNTVRWGHFPWFSENQINKHRLNLLLLSSKERIVISIFAWILHELRWFQTNIDNQQPVRHNQKRKKKRASRIVN